MAKHKVYRIGPVEASHPTSEREARVKCEHRAATALHADYQPEFFQIRDESAMMYRTPLSGWCYVRLMDGGSAREPNKRCIGSGENPLDHSDPVPYRELRRRELNRMVMHIVQIALCDVEPDLDTIAAEIRKAAETWLTTPDDVDAVSIAMEHVDYLRWQIRYKAALAATGGNDSLARALVHGAVA